MAATISGTDKIVVISGQLASQHEHWNKDVKLPALL